MGVRSSVDLRDDLRIGAAGSEGCVVVPLQVKDGCRESQHPTQQPNCCRETGDGCHGLHALHTRRVKYDKRRRANL